MPKLVRMYITQVAIGFVLSALFVVALLWLNVGNLRHLITSSDIGLLAAFLLWMFNGIVFSGVQFGIAIMRMADDDTPKGGTHKPVITGELARVPSKAHDSAK